MIFQAATTPESRKARPWIILYGHRPMYCSDDDGDELPRGLDFSLTEKESTNPLPHPDWLIHFKTESWRL